ncbi:MAG: GTP pyrophosphokinase family protein [Clostridiales bacterium]|nr:GTP pyrophosphokinase family protein [Clostridiales bacterium]
MVLKNDHIISSVANGGEARIEALEKLTLSFLQIQCRYNAAIREVLTKLDILNEEFELLYKRNPIHNMQSRLKSIPSIANKLKRRNLPIDFDVAVKHLHDIAGIRVICSYIDDIYVMADLLKKQDDVTVIKEIDYIKSPKANGYRSLHLVLEIPVFLSEGKIFVPIEIQLRTIAMDFWASLEHQLRYKNSVVIPEGMQRELKHVATEIADIDQKMQDILTEVENLPQSESV